MSTSVKTSHVKPLTREIELDFVRGIAILMVIDFHSPMAVLFYPFKLMGFHRFGWAGVDVFFVLSGFLVGGLLVKEWQVRGRIDGKRFLIRRGFKIWPQYYLFLFIMLTTRHRTLRQLWGNLLNIQNYVGGVAHTWTLGVEEHAYLLLVLCLAIAARRATRMRTLFFFLSGTIAFVIVLRLFLSMKGFNTFESTHTRIDGILEGVLLAILYHHAPERFRNLQKRTWVWLAVLVLTLIYFRVDPQRWWSPSLSYDCANALGIALLMLLYRHKPGKRYPAIYRFVAWLGVYSYGIYLWHVSVIAPIERIASYLPHWTGVACLAILPILLGSLIGIVTTKFVELPALKLRDELYPRVVDHSVALAAEYDACIEVGA